MKELITKILEFAKSNKDGFTLDVRTLEPITTGYVASYKATQNSFTETDLQSVIVHAIKHDGIVGGWFNSENKRYYFDSNKVFESKDQAVNFAIENNQLAIFDLDNCREIRLDERTYYVQEIIGGWRQNAAFCGTFEECQKFVNERCYNGSFNIVSEKDYEVDYL